LTLKQLIGYGAVRLFVERGRAARQGFALSEGNRAMVAAVCARLDGIPLAIELAATRLAMLGVEDVVARLDDRFRLLAGWNRGALPRHQTLRAVLDWSYDLLAEGERRLLRALAVFVDGWRLPAAATVCAADGIDGQEILDLLGGLVHKSLVQAHEDGEGRRRYRLLETVRVYALEQLEAAGDLDALRARHAGWCLVLAEEAALGLEGPQQGEWLAQLGSEHDNLRAALRWLLSEPERSMVELGARLAAALWRFWSLAGYVAEGRYWLALVLQQRAGLPLALQARVLHAAGRLAYDQADYALTADLAGQALTLQRRLDDRPGIAASLNALGNVAWALGDLDEATALYEHSLAIWREIDNARHIALCIDNMGAVASVQKDFARARALHQESLAIRQRIGDAHGTALALYNLSALAFAQQDWLEAGEMLRRAVAVWREMGARRDLASAVVQFAMLAQARGSLERAALLLAAGEQLRLLMGEGLRDEDEAEIAQTTQALREQLSGASFATAWALGQAMSLEDALACGLDAANTPVG
jgi:non-specific serine/threonine protein kinase